MLRDLDRRDRARAPGAGLVATVLVVGACGGSDAVGSGPATQSPAAESPPAQSSSTPEPAAAEEQKLSVGVFERIGYDGEGEARVVDTDDGVEVRFSDFRVEQAGPARVPLGRPRRRRGGTYDDDFIDLGVLEAFRGDQTYFVPSGTDVADFRSVVIWCAEFTVGFVVAPIRVR